MSKNRSQRALGNFRKRKNFARIPTVIDIPNLIEIQKKSFEYFLQWDIAPADRVLRGLEEVFSDVFPISDLNINARIEYVGFEVGIWECGCGEFKELDGPAVVCSACKQQYGRGANANGLPRTTVPESSWFFKTWNIYDIYCQHRCCGHCFECRH